MRFSLCVRACVFAFVNSRCAKVRAAVEEANSEVFSVLWKQTHRGSNFFCVTLNIFDFLKGKREIKSIEEGRNEFFLFLMFI